MPATGLDFSVTSDETALGFALAEFTMLQPLNEGPSPELPSAGSEAEGTCNLTLGET